MNMFLKFTRCLPKLDLTKCCTVCHSKNLYHKTEPNIIKSKVPDINIPDGLLEEFIWKDLHKWHDKDALECAESGRKYNYWQLYKKSIGLSNFLHNFPTLTQHDTVAIILPNVPEYPIITLGAIQAGLKVTTVSPLFTEDEIRKQLIASETKLIFTSYVLWDRVRRATAAIPNLPIVVVKSRLEELLPTKAINFDEISVEENKLAFNIKRSIDDVVLLPYSSGTTGLPKGVELTNKSIVSNLYQMNTGPHKLHESADGPRQEIIPSVLPLFHIYGHSVGMLNMLSAGSKFVTIPKYGSKIFLDVLEKHKPTFAYLVPPIVLFLLNDERVHPKHILHMHTIVCGAAPLGAADLERFRVKIEGKVNLLQGYGLTETSPLTHTQLKSTHAKAGSSGYPVPNTECKVVAIDDDANTGLGCNKSGELFIRGPQVMKGYYKNAEATKNAITTDGWFRTGDIVHYDEDAEFFITDRIKELIKVKGYQVAPAEIEELLRNHPNIDEAAVVGIPHQDYGEVPKAFIVLRNNSKFSYKDITEYMAKKLSKYKQLTGGIIVLNEIPKTASGKILRRQLRQM